MKKVIAYIGFLLLLTFLAFLYGFASNRNGDKTIKNTVVEFEAGDNNFLTHSLVDKMLIQNNDFVKNQAKRIVDLHFLETKVSASPYVEKAAVYMTVDGVLKTLIKQRKPLARIVNKNNSFYVDKQGVEIPISKNFSARVPLISGVGSPDEIDEVTELINVIANDDFLNKEVIAIDKTAKNEYRFSVRSGNYKVHFGKFVNVDKKIKKLKAFYNKAFIDKSINEYEVINLKYHNQVVCTKQS
ncbi:cell division protein FtsQ/DivIB [uncultured Tenacibaculum sp.]|uniref:cell division protein FtsQ/DivIB n=1 Tax=uncultured Tenacibaculum sp. TaxID=174713 RepID=UPI002627C4B9|nr:cell division protein FtsQ/DivIB [uncultured Tenacibaculum sp.]